jgi:hypothetical protein
VSTVGGASNTLLILKTILQLPFFSPRSKVREFIEIEKYKVGEQSPLSLGEGPKRGCPNFNFKGKSSEIQKGQASNLPKATQ